MAVLILLSLITLILLLVYRILFTLLLFTLSLLFTIFLTLDLPVDISFGAHETFFEDLVGDFCMMISPFAQGDFRLN